MPEQIPITPAILIWARERAGLSREEVLQKFKRFADWETGKSFPTYPQLEQLSETFKVPIAVFFFPSPPQTPPINETFRTLPDSELTKFPSRMRMLLRKAKVLQINLHELTMGRNPAPKLITSDITVDSTAAIPPLAAVVREYLGISLETQTKWKDNETALKAWREALLKAGVFVFKDAFRLDEYSGFCLFDETFPIIYVNNTSSKTRQIFTYFHELAHLLFHTSGIDTIHDSFIPNLRITDQKLEVFCNQFAAHFLLPDLAFVKALGNRPANESTAEILAAEFHVSREVVFRRFLDKGRISEAQYKLAVERWNDQRQSIGGEGGDYYWTKIAYLGRDYVSLALGQFYQNKIDETKLADYLDTKPKNLNTLETYFQRGTD